jgi:hypothetical protein
VSAVLTFSRCNLRFNLGYMCVPGVEFMKIFAIILALAVSGAVYYAKYGHKQAGVAQPPPVPSSASVHDAFYRDAQVNPYAVGY